MLKAHTFRAGLSLDLHDLLHTHRCSLGNAGAPNL